MYLQLPHPFFNAGLVTAQPTGFPQLRKSPTAAACAAALAEHVARTFDKPGSQ